MMHLWLLFILAAEGCEMCLPLRGDQKIQWEAFKNKYKKRYCSECEECYRGNIFLKNVKLINEHNLRHEEGNETYRMGINQFTDMTKGEPYNMEKCLVEPLWVPRYENVYEPCVPMVLPSTADWRKQGAVTAVKDQGGYITCSWAFSATGSIEGAWYRKTYKLVSLSEQNLLDCTGNMTCQDGWPFMSFQYVFHNNGIQTEESYPFEGQKYNCRYNDQGKGAVVLTHKRVWPGNEYHLQKALAREGPISVLIYINDNFMLYREGIFSDKNCLNNNAHLNHAALLVGYGTLNGQAYWLVKNSWGTSWGMDGYFMMARNKDNMCGIATAASFPIV